MRYKRQNFEITNMVEDLPSIAVNSTDTWDPDPINNYTASPIVDHRGHDLLIPIGYIMGMCGVIVVLVIALGVIVVFWRRKRPVLLPEHSIYTTQDTWDNLSLNYIDNPSDFQTKDSWESMSDDSYYASLEEAIAQQAKAMHKFQNASRQNAPRRPGHRNHQPHRANERLRMAGAPATDFSSRQTSPTSELSL